MSWRSRNKAESVEGHLRPDHVHMCISIPPKFSVSSVVGFIKGAIGGIAFGRHHIESELASQFGEGFLLGASPSSEVPKALDGERFVRGDG